MKKATFIIVGLAIISIASLTIFNTQNKTDKREKFEKFLKEQYRTLPDLSQDEIKDLPKLDRPDLAAFVDFIKTVDPDLERSPNSRTFKAFNELKQQSTSLKSTQGQLDWTEHPTDMGGRTRAIMFDPNDPTNSKVWAGAVTGGLWFSDDPIRGLPWQPINDFYSNLSISSIAYDPNTTTTFYAGTGESQTALIMYRESSGRGSGIFKSVNAGESWEIIPSTSEWAYVTDVMVRDENGESVIYAGVISGIYKGKLHESQPSDGLYRSTDGGDSWTQVLPNVPSGNRPYAPSDIEFTADNSKIFVGTTYHGTDREGASCILYSENGTDWTLVDKYYNEILMEDENKFPGRVMLAHAPSNPNIVFAAIATGKVRPDQFIGYDCNYIVKTTDNGANWEQINHQSGFAYLAWHALTITVSPLNPNMIWVGGLDVWRTTNGGDSWTKYSNWARMYGGSKDDYVHADIHAIKFKPGSDTDLIIATDGGIFCTTNAPATTPVFKELNRGYSTLQYYAGAIHPEAGSSHIIGGLQDNGTMFYSTGQIPTYTNMLSGGDGAFCFIDQDEPSLHLTTVYYNSLYVYNGEHNVKPGYGRGQSLNSGTFVNPMDYNSRDDILFANEIEWGGGKKNTLLIAGISASNINPLHHILDTDTEIPFSTVKWSENSPIGESTVFLGTESGRLFKLPDAVRQSATTELTGADFPAGYISSIDQGASDDTLLTTFSNYGIESIWYSTDGGQSWLSKEGNLPDIPVRWGIIHPQSGVDVMIATDLGTWTTNNILADPVIWTQNISGMANVRVDMLKFRKSDNTVLSVTHGRGMYTTVWNPDYSSSVSLDELNSEIKVYPNPSNGVIQIEFLPMSRTELLITDITGKIVFQEKYESSLSVQSRTIDLSDQAKGLYMISLTSGNGKKISKLLIQ